MDKTEQEYLELNPFPNELFDRFFRNPAYIEDEEDETPIEPQGDVV